MTHRTPSLVALLSLALLALWSTGPALAPALAEDPPAPVAPPVAPPAEAPADAPADAKPATDKAPGRQPMLWMIEGSPRVFLYGTIHVPDKRVLAHLPVVQQALDQSTALYTELPMDPAGMQAMQMGVMQRAPMTDGQSLKDVLGDELHGKVAKCMPPQIPFAFLQNMKPWLIQLILLQTLIGEHTKKIEAEQKAEAGEDASGPSDAPKGPKQALDAVLYNTAAQAGKEVGGLETIDVQLDAFDSLSMESQIRMVGETIDEIVKLKKANAKTAAGAEDEGAADEEEEPDGLSQLLDLWLAGDDNAFLEIFAEETKKQGAGETNFVEMLIDKRNVGMADKVVELMKAGPKKTYFIAVGAGHMPGEKGVVALLQAKGLKVHRIKLGAKLTPVPAPKAPAAEAKPEPAGTGAGG